MPPPSTSPRILVERTLARRSFAAENPAAAATPAWTLGDRPDQWDLPSEIDRCGRMLWRRPNGDLHRAGHKPAIVGAGGRHREWWIDGSPHRDGDLPARTFPDGTAEWWQYGMQHRGHDKPAVVSDKGMEWFVRGRRHRDGGRPAVTDRTNWEWYEGGVLHRDHGLPAVISSNGWVEYWVHGELDDRLKHRDWRRLL
jgi:hypothetical protein